jgi:hypothetical protein
MTDTSLIHNAFKAATLALEANLPEKNVFGGLLADLSKALQVDQIIWYTVEYDNLRQALVHQRLIADHGSGETHPPTTETPLLLRKLGLDLLQDQLIEGKTGVADSLIALDKDHAYWQKKVVATVQVSLMVSNRWWGGLSINSTTPHWWVGEELMAIQTGALTLAETLSSLQQKRESSTYTDASDAIKTILADEKSPVDARIEELLKLGLETLGLDMAIVSHIKDQTYTVKYFAPESSGLSRGQIFELGQTYCSITLNYGRVLGIPYAEYSTFTRHPCHHVFKLESYVGQMVTHDGKPYGTVNFSSPNPHSPFTQSQNQLVGEISDAVQTLFNKHSLY